MGNNEEKFETLLAYGECNLTVTGKLHAEWFSNNISTRYIALISTENISRLIRLLRKLLLVLITWSDAVKRLKQTNQQEKRFYVRQRFICKTLPVKLLLMFVYYWNLLFFVFYTAIIHRFLNKNFTKTIFLIVLCFANIYKEGDTSDFDNFSTNCQNHHAKYCCEYSSRGSPFIEKLLSEKVYSKVHNIPDTVYI